MDYDALAKQSGATNVDYDALAQQSGGERTLASLITGKNPADEAKAAGQRYQDLFGGGARKKGAALPSSVQGLMSAMQGPTFGFADEAAGVGAAFAGLTRGDLNVADNYQQGRDLYRGGAADIQGRHPIQSGLTQLATSAPVMAASGGASASAAVPVTMGRGAMTAAKSGAVYGGISGAGNSEANTASGIASDAALGAGTSAALGGASVPIARGMGAAGRGAMARIREAAANSYAKEKVAEALVRDAAGRIPQQSATGGVIQAAARLGKLGDDAMVVDAAGKNTRQMLDNLATLPGRTGNAVERAIRERQAARGGNLVTAAKNALGVSGGYVDDMANFTTQREMAAKPLYDKAFAEAPPIVVPKDILLRDSVRAAYDKAQKLAAERGVSMPPINPNAVQPIPPLNLRQADFLKRAMDDVLFAAKMPTSNVGKNQYGLMMDTRTALVSAIDDQAGPAYAAARSAFAGPTRAMEAAELGRGLLKEDATAIPSMLRGLGESEREALKIGTVQAVKDMAGSQAGQTKLLKMWANPGMREKLQLVFGKDFRSFQRAVMAEERKKGLEAVGRGSQTFAREAGAEDLGIGAAMDAGQAAAGVVGGNPVASMPWLRQQASRIGTPEAVRDEMGRLLMTKGAQGQNSLNDLMQYAERVNRARATQADAAGRFVGLQAPSLLLSR